MSLYHKDRMEKIQIRRGNGGALKVHGGDRERRRWRFRNTRGPVACFDIPSVPGGTERVPAFQPRCQLLADETTVVVNEIKFKKKNFHTAGL